MSNTIPYNLSITGDCTNSFLGGFTVDIISTSPDYTIQWLSPYSSTIPLGPGVTVYTINTLSAGTYSFNIIDSFIPNNVQPVNVYVSSGTSVSLIGEKSTLCGFSNGSLTANTTNIYGISSFYLYDYTDGYITSGSSNDNTHIFNNLSASTYYIVADDGGGCTGKTETYIVKSSSTIDYGFYVIEDAGCFVNSGKIYITGLTGNPPYTYLWSNGKTTSSIDGLSVGIYSVVVTDNTGCSITKATSVSVVLPVSIGAMYVTPPSCFTSDGEVTVTIVNGTAPYYYQGSNGDVYVGFNTTHTFTGIGPGYFTVTVTDAGLCTSSSSTSVLTPNGFTLTNIVVNNSNCNNIGGSIKPITLFGGSGNYTYSLTYPDGSILSQDTTNPTWGFENLSGGTYTLEINDGVCYYSNEYTIVNEVLYELSTITSETSCGNPNGTVTLNITTGGTPPYVYEINGHSFSTPLSSHTFNNLISGNYFAKVTDKNYCTQTKYFTINNSSNVVFNLNGTDAVNGSDGVINTYITDGEPPFTLLWSSNVNGQTGYTVTNLSAGTYSLKITDTNGCVSTRETIINGFTTISSYQTYNIYNNNFENNGELIKKGIKQMFIEGFYDLTINDINCVLNSAIFSIRVVAGNIVIVPFYTTNSLGDYPSDIDMLNVLESTLLEYPQIGSVIVNIFDNQIVIKTDCELTSLVNTNVIADVLIKYDISCVLCVTPTPTPTPTVTPTVTPTHTPTPTPTPTPSTTPSVIYYVFRPCNGRIFLIQPVLPIVGLTVGGSFYGTTPDVSDCFTLVDISQSLYDLELTYPNNIYSSVNYFISVDTTIYGTCADCVKVNTPTPIPPKGGTCSVKYIVDNQCRETCNTVSGTIKNNNIVELNLISPGSYGVTNGSFVSNVGSLIEISLETLSSPCGNTCVKYGIYDNLGNLLINGGYVCSLDTVTTSYNSFVLTDVICSQNPTIKITTYCIITG